MNKKTFPLVALPYPASRLRAASLSFLALCLLLICAANINAASDRKSKTEAAKDGAECKVENFGKVNENFYRGAQPEEDQYEQLAGLGVKTILDLRHDPKSYAKTMAERAGLRYINLPMSDTKYPPEEQVKQFLELANTAENWPMFVHCAGGRHRTGAMLAVYRMTNEGWDINRAYEEMKDYDFYTRWGHKAMKTFVFNYYKELQARRPRATATEAVMLAPTQDN
jgi:tyrosine-protein phosphatase SIW14